MPSNVADLTAATALDGDELLYVVDDPAGTPLDRKVTVDNLVPRELGNAIVTANQTGITTTMTDVTGMSLTVTVGSRPIIVEAWFQAQKKTGAGYVQAKLLDNTAATDIAYANLQLPVDDYGFIHLIARVAPASGSRTYKVQAKAETNTFDLIASAVQPALFRVYEVHPA